MTIRIYDERGRQFAWDERRGEVGPELGLAVAKYWSARKEKAFSGFTLESRRRRESYDNQGRRVQALPGQ